MSVPILSKRYVSSLSRGEKVWRHTFYFWLMSVFFKVQIEAQSGVCLRVVWVASNIYMQMPTPQPAAFDEPNWRWDLGIQAFKNSLSMFLRPALGWKPLRSPHGSPVASGMVPLPLLLLGLVPVLPTPPSDFLGHTWTSTAADSSILVSESRKGN